VRGYIEEGTTTTPFDMTVLNQLDRYNLAMDVIDRVERLQGTSGAAREDLKNKLIEHKIHTRRYGEDQEEVRSWQWSPAAGPRAETEDASRTAPEG